MEPLEQDISNASASASALVICWATASTIGITMAAAEVLLSHIDKKAQLTMKPSVSLEQERRVCGCYSNTSIWYKWKAFSTEILNVDDLKVVL